VSAFAREVHCLRTKKFGGNLQRHFFGGIYKNVGIAAFPVELLISTGRRQVAESCCFVFHSLLLPATLMYGSLSESTVLSSADSKPTPVYTFFEASEDFVEFLSGRIGMHEILLHEDTSNVEIKLEPSGFGITHLPDVPVKPIEMSLRKLYHDVEFSKSLRLSSLNARCTASQVLYLTALQYALLHETKLAILRSAGLCDILMDHGGRICLFGSVESVIEGHMAIKRIFVEQGLGEPRTRPPSALGIDCDSNNNQVPCTLDDTIMVEKKAGDMEWNPDTSRPPPPLLAGIDLLPSEHTISHSSTSGRGNSIYQSCSYNSVANGSSRLSPESESSTLSTAVLIEDQRKTIVEESHRKSIKFFVNLADAPRLIGTRGTNKRRIEQVTGCTIVLHTEKKDNGEFPIEIFSTSSKRCEIARQHILGYLANSRTAVEDMSSSNVKKEIRARPKVHLDISPKKLNKKHTD
ncbi:hypothetical protein V3C99_000729, partial [Haemonchus contortus]